MNCNMPRHSVEEKKIIHNITYGYSIENSSTFSTHRKQALLYTAHEDRRGLGGDGNTKQKDMPGDYRTRGPNETGGEKQMATTMRWV